MLSQKNLAVYYKTLFILTQHYKYSLESIENILPYERDLYFSMIIDFIEEQKRKLENV